MDSTDSKDTNMVELTDLEGSRSPQDEAQSSEAVANGVPAHSRLGSRTRPFAVTFLALQTVFILLYAIFSEYDDIAVDASSVVNTTSSLPAAGAASNIASFYWYFNHVVIMMPIGFGYLVTFLRKYRYSGVGFTYVLTALIFQWSLLVLAFWEKVETGHWSRFKWSLLLFIQAMYCVASHLITLGGIIGKVTMEQLLVLMLPQTIIYGANWYICATLIKATDVGGSLIIHVFGCYYGLAATTFLSKQPMRSFNVAHEPGYASDLFSMIGTIFLWIMWPSFNAATALPHLQYRVIINTVLSLSAATVVSFGWSSILRGGKMAMEDVQNATLAGGVAIGAVADLHCTPAGALAIGLIAATVSCFGFRYINPWLARNGLYDTCGIHNLHGMPGLIGGLASVVVTAVATPATYGADYLVLMPHGATQWGHQLAAIAVTLSLALVSGTIFGLIAMMLPMPTTVFHDSETWEVPAALRGQEMPRKLD